MNLSLRDSKGRKLKKFEIVVNGRERQTTPTKILLTQAVAEFGKISFQDGDFILSRALREDGSFFESNPIYIGNSWLESKKDHNRGWIRIRFSVVDRQFKPVDEMRAAIRAHGTYFEKTIQQGSLEMDLPLNAMIHFDGKGFKNQKVDVLKRFLLKLDKDPRWSNQALSYKDLKELGDNFIDVIIVDRETTSRQ